MRTYIVHKVHSTGQNRIETRDPIERELNERPNRDNININMTHDVSLRSYDIQSIDNMYQTITSELFDNCRLITMIWVESHVSGGTSFGYYNKFVSYFQLPHDITIDGLIRLEPGEHVYSRLNTTPYRMDDMFYRHKIVDLENKLRELEKDKVIVTKEELNEINKPIPVQYFDETIFEME